MMVILKVLSFQMNTTRDESINHPRSWYITSDGIQYLEENSLIRKAYNTLKEANDWLPLMQHS